jgi:hypothetical protein
MSVKYSNSFQSRAHQNLPKLGFLVSKETIWQPWYRNVHLPWYVTVNALLVLAIQSPSKVLFAIRCRNLILFRQNLQKALQRVYCIRTRGYYDSLQIGIERKQLKNEIGNDFI